MSKPKGPTPRSGSHLVLVLPDMHVPLHDRAALGCVLAVHDFLAPAKTLILGDWLDCEAFSSYPRNQKMEDKATLYHEDEILPVRAILERFEKRSQEIIYLAGNHEHRVERKLIELGEVGAGIANLVDPGKLLGKGRKAGWQYIEYSRRPGSPLPHYKIAKDLIAVHGWSFAKHAAAKHLEIARSYSVVHGHTHRAQSYTAREPITGRTIKAWSPGCLSQLQPIYMQHSPADWVHGFSLVYVSDEQDAWTEYTVEIKNGVCFLPGGQKIDGNKWIDEVKAIEEGAGS